MEFSCDPLFRKATAKFDERGAKGLTQNVSKLSHKGLEIMFYTGNAENEQEKISESQQQNSQNSLANVISSQYKSQILSTATESLKNFNFEDISSKKINENILEYKHKNLGIPYPVLELTPFAIAQASFTQSLARLNISEIKPGTETQPPVLDSVPMETNPIEDDHWLSKLNTDKTDEELSLMGFTGTQETGQTFDDVFFNFLYKILDSIDCRRMQNVRFRFNSKRYSRKIFRFNCARGW